MKGLASFIYFEILDKHFNGKMVYALGLSDFIKYFPIGLINASKKNVINGRENRRNIKYHHVKVLHVVFVVP